MDAELEWLYERRTEIQDQINSYFIGVDDPNESDMGYQELWEELDEINDHIINYKEC